MRILSTPIPDLALIKTNRSIDKRGLFWKLYCEEELAPIIGRRHIHQVNFSQTAKVGTIRGMHFQYPPHSEMKFVKCIKGRVWDVAVDLRAGSATFLHWHAVELSQSNTYMKAIPEGFAHGFQSLEENSELLYLHTAHYNPAAEGRVNYGDPRLNIDWPLPVTDLSPKDANQALMKSNYRGIIL